jgi:hypothetical protein
MRRNSDLQRRFPAFYRQDLLIEAREARGLEIQDVSKATGIPYASIQRAELGGASNKIIKPLQEYYGLDWEKLHDLPGDKRSRSKTKVQKLALAVSGLGGSLSAG